MLNDLTRLGVFNYKIFGVTYEFAEYYVCNSRKKKERENLELTDLPSL